MWRSAQNEPWRMEPTQTVNLFKVARIWSVLWYDTVMQDSLSVNECRTMPNSSALWRKCSTSVLESNLWVSSGCRRSVLLWHILDHMQRKRLLLNTVQSIPSLHCDIHPCTEVACHLCKRGEIEYQYNALVTSRCQNTVRRGEIETGISEACKRVSIFSFATQGGK